MADSRRCAPPPATAVTIAILPIEGVANENARLLASALNFHLQQFGVNTAPPSGKAQQVRGTVKITEKPGSQQRKLAFVWTVLAPDGKEIGKLARPGTLAVVVCLALSAPGTSLAADPQKVLRVAFETAPSKRYGNLCEPIPRCFLSANLQRAFRWSKGYESWPLSRVRFPCR